MNYERKKDEKLKQAGKKDVEWKRYTFHEKNWEKEVQKGPGGIK